jgi:hypothetical protein
MRGRHWIVFGTKNDVAAYRRQASEKLNFPVRVRVRMQLVRRRGVLCNHHCCYVFLALCRLHSSHAAVRHHGPYASPVSRLTAACVQATLAFTKSKLSPAVPSASMLSAALPANVKLLTLTNNYVSINDGALLLRLAHLYQASAWCRGYRCGCRTGSRRA